MAFGINKLAKAVADILRRDDTDRGYDTTAEVKRIEDGTAWVHFPGGEDETPVRMTVNANVGDNVQVRVSGGRAFIIGNGSAPPTDDRRAIIADENAHAAGAAAESAIKDAARAKDAADSAQRSADEAQQSATTANMAANGALLGLSTVQDVIGVLTWAEQNAEYQLTADTEIIPGKVYWTRSGSGTSADPYVYTPVAVPVAADLGSYYEITSVDEAMAEYINSHLALTDAGLYVLKDGSGYRLRLSNDGTYLESPQGYIVNQNTANGNTVRASNGTVIAHFGYGEGASQSGTTSAPYYTIGERKANSTIGNWSSVEGKNGTASAFCSHAEGFYTTASGQSSHAEGDTTTASNYYAHAEGASTEASGRQSHSEGFATVASGDSSHAGGLYTIAAGEAQTVIGKYNVQDSNSLFIVGNGTSSARSNAFKLSSGGIGYFASAIGTGGKTAWNDTAHDGVWLSSTGEIHLTEQSASRGGTISFHFNRSASATTSLYEGTSGVLTNTGRLVTSDWSGTGRTPVSSATTDGGRISYLQATVASLRVAGQWGTAGGSYTITDFLPPTSDIRLKKNVEDCEVEDALSVINRIKMHSFDWLHTDEHQRIGFVADELEGIDPKLAVGGGKEKDGTIHYKTVDTFYLLGYLTKAVQELSEQNAKLTAELNALKEVVK